MSEVTTGHEIESEIGHVQHCSADRSRRVKRSKARVKCARNGNPASLLISCPTVTYLMKNGPSPTSNWCSSPTAFTDKVVLRDVRALQLLQFFCSGVVAVSVSCQDSADERNMTFAHRYGGNSLRLTIMKMIII